MWQARSIKKNIQRKNVNVVKMKYSESKKLCEYYYMNILYLFTSLFENSNNLTLCGMKISDE